MKHETTSLIFVCIILLASPVLAIGPFIDNSESITDQGTGLVWQQQTGDVNGDGSITEGDYPLGDEVVWLDALAYCEGLSLSGETDWRLPNIRELKSLVGRAIDDPSIGPLFQCQSGDYWSSTTSVYNDTSTKLAWFVSFVHGWDGYDYKVNYYHYIRCVRGGGVSAQNQSGFPWPMVLPALIKGVDTQKRYIEGDN